MTATASAIDREIAVFMAGRKLTVEKMAALMSMSANTLRSKREGRADWRWSEILKLCDLLGKTPNDFACLE